MRFLEQYNITSIKYDFLYRYNYKKINYIPNIQKVVLNFGFKRPNFMNLISSLTALEFITTKKGNLTTSKRSNINLKIKKGNPVGCNVELKKKQIFLFINQLLTMIFPKLKNFIILITPLNSKKSITFTIQNILVFSQLETQYQYFKNLSELNITIVTNAKTITELVFLLKSFKFPIKIQTAIVTQW